MIFLPHRTILRVSGADRKSFLQGLITNDIQKLSGKTPLYAALLNPQGKVLFDFLLFEEGETILLDCWKEKAVALLQRLALYKLRAKVTFAEDPALYVYADISTHPLPHFLTDPRHSGLGQRLITSTPQASSPAAEYEAHRIALGIPESQDFIEERSFPMEFGLTDLHAISYTKGCYVGQEVIARSRTRGVLHKALHRITAKMDLPVMGTPITANGQEIGQLRSVANTTGLAMLRIQEAQEATELMAGNIPITATLPDWFSLPTPVMQNV